MIKWRDAIERRKFEDYEDIVFSYKILFFQYVTIRHMRELVGRTQDFFHDYNDALCQDLKYCTRRLRSMEKYMKENGNNIDCREIQEEVLRWIYLKDFYPKKEDTLTYQFKHLTKEQWKK